MKMNQPLASSIRGLWRTIVACSVLGGISIAQSVPPKEEIQSTNQTILFSPVLPQSASNTVQLEAVASSGLPVTFRSKTSSICTVKKSVVSLHRGGECTVEALQLGNKLYAVAPVVMQSFTARPAKRCCGLFDIAQDGTIVLPAVQGKLAFCPMPALDPVTPLTPDTWIPGSTVQLTIKGSGFTTTDNATKTCPATAVTVEMEGHPLDLTNMKVVNSATITVTVRVSPDLPGGAVKVLLWGPDPSVQDASPAAPSAPRQ